MNIHGPPVKGMKFGNKSIFTTKTVSNGGTNTACAAAGNKS